MVRSSGHATTRPSKVHRSGAQHRQLRARQGQVRHHRVYRDRRKERPPGVVDYGKVGRVGRRRATPMTIETQQRLFRAMRCRRPGEERDDRPLFDYQYDRAGLTFSGRRTRELRAGSMAGHPRTSVRGAWRFGRDCSETCSAGNAACRLMGDRGAGGSWLISEPRIDDHGGAGAGRSVLAREISWSRRVLEGTERCNFRCVYCMAEHSVVFGPKPIC